MQSCWMENPLMRPTFEDITKRIKYLLRTFKVCVTDILVMVIVSASNNYVFFALFSVSVHLYSYTNFSEKDLFGKFLSCCLYYFSNSLIIHQV